MTTITTSVTDDAAERFNSDLSALEREMFNLARKAFKQGYDIWVETPSGEYRLYEPCSDLVDFVVRKRLP